MPVPVPRTSKLVAHPVIKKNKSGGLQANPFQNLTRTLPLSPTGPPPSYGTREQWIESLPTWRRQKPRRIWEDDNNSQIQQPAAQDFSQGLTVAANAPVIKGERAQACIPPLCTMLAPSIPKVVSANDGEADDEMDLDLPQWKWEPCIDYAIETLPQEFGAPNPSPASVVSIPAAHPYERGAFSPVFEDDSPGFGSGLEASSSPMEPVTPFCDFVDRVVAGTLPSKQSGGMDFNGAVNAIPKARVPCLQDFQSAGAGQIVDQPKQPAQVPVSATIPSSTAAYKKLAEPLAEWMASYVWKVCTTGYNLPSNYVNPTSIPIARFLDPPPLNLAPSIHSVLLSTLLHPSAVFLALWYIVRLPVYCGSITLGPEHMKELCFRTALFGDTRTATTSGDSILQLSPMDESVPFRLVLVGCMLANKWLDDHTFSNKTWHSISNVPIHLLNELEILALDLFSYNLSVPHDKWSDWMEHIRSHHLSSMPPSHVQPISRPSSNPHLIIRKAIEDIIHTRLVVYPFPQPAFLGLEQRKKEKMENEKAMDDINLDEDGPLREEYLPRRRTNGAIGKPGFPSSTNSATQHNLPPPAKWSPAGDEPIFRDRQRMSGNYVAVQAPGMTAFPAWPVSYSHSNFQDQTWISHGNAAEAKLSTGYGYEVANHHLAAFLPYPYPHAIPMIHMRTHSLSHDNAQIRGHIRTFSQNCFDSRPNNVHMGALDVVAGDESIHWFAANSHAYAVPAYAYHSSVVHQPAWIQT